MDPKAIGSKNLSARALRHTEERNGSPFIIDKPSTYRKVKQGRDIDFDLPLNFHPTTTGARLLFTPIGAG